MSERRQVLQRGLWFEEFEVDTVYMHRPGRTMTEADNVLFTTLTMNTQALHLDAAWAAEAYPRFGDFLAQRDAVDPGRVFANDHLNRVLGA